MTWTYSGDPASSNRDAVRFLVGDTDTTDQLVTDEEIAWLLSENSDDVYTAAADSARAIAASFARKATTKVVDDLRIEFMDRSARYYALAAQLTAEAQQRSQVAVPWGGGLSISERDSDDDDTDLPGPRFRRGQFAHSDHGTADESAPEWDEDGV